MATKQAERSKSKKPKKKLESNDVASSKANRFERAVAEMKKDGCEEADIIGLLEAFAAKDQELEKAYDELAVTESEILEQEGKAGGSARKDIG